MQTLKIMMIGATLAAFVVLMPGHTAAQQATEPPAKTDCPKRRD